MTDLKEMLRTTHCQFCRGTREIAADRIEELEAEKAESRRWQNLTRLKELEKANAELNHMIGEYVDKTAELVAENERLRAVARHAQALLDGGGDEAVYHLRKALQQTDND